VHFALIPVFGQEICPVGFERSEVFANSSWKRKGRWRLDVELLRRAIRNRCVSLTDSGLPGALVLRLQVGDLHTWGETVAYFFSATTYVRSKRELTVSVQLNYRKVRNLEAQAQFTRLRTAVLHAVTVAQDELDVPGTVDLAVLRSQLQRVLSSIRVDEVVARAAA
jgi:hypothetical protein